MPRRPKAIWFGVNVAVGLALAFWGCKTGEIGGNENHEDSGALADSDPRPDENRASDPSADSGSDFGSLDSGSDLGTGSDSESDSGSATDVDSTSCGNKICDPSETCSSCSRDCIPCPLADPPEGFVWNYIWGDEFEGDSVDTAKWRIYGDKRSADSNKTWYRPENVSIAGGILKLEVNNQQICEGSNCADYTGGMLESYDANNTSDSNRYRVWQYGYFEAKIKYHLVGPGYWANFWMCGRPWPPELDLEVVSRTGSDGTTDRSKQIRAAYHYRNTSGTHKAAYSWCDVTYNDSWHTYGYLWLPGEPIKFFLDDQLVYTSDATDDPNNNSPTTPQYISLRAGAFNAKDWGGIPDATTEWPGYAEYDWVRVYAVEAK